MEAAAQHAVLAAVVEVEFLEVLHGGAHFADFFQVLLIDRQDVRMFGEKFQRLIDEDAQRVESS
jgi:hypothetical protein